MAKSIRYVGLDVHADTIAVAVCEGRGEGRSLGTIPNRPEPIRKLVKRNPSASGVVTKAPDLAEGWEKGARPASTAAIPVDQSPRLHVKHQKTTIVVDLLFLGPAPDPTRFEEPDGDGTGAILIRAGVPVLGLADRQARRHVEDDLSLVDGAHAKPSALLHSHVVAPRPMGRGPFELGQILHQLAEGHLPD